MKTPTTKINFGTRFWQKVEKTESCWLWVGSTNGRGYGEMRTNGNKKYAHRLAYEMEYGVAPKGLDIDHLCKNPGCVRPSHLEAVTHQENVRRGDAASLKGNDLREVCKRGHVAAEVGVYKRPDRVNACRQCLRENSARMRARKD